MALLDVVGFEKGSFTAGVEIDSNTGTPTIDTTNPYTGSARAMRVNGAASNQFITRQFINNAGTRFWQFRLRIHDASGASASAMALIRDSVNGNGPSIRLNAARTLELWDEQGALQQGSDSAALSIDTYYLIGLSYNKTTGAIALYIDDLVTPVASGTTTSGMTMDTYRLGTIDAFTCDISFDDCIVTDSSGAAMTGFAGNVLVHYAAPSAAGDVNTFATQTGGTVGAANNFTRVNEITPDDATTLNGSSTLNEEDLFNVTDAPANMGTVSAYVVGGRFRNQTADATAAFKFEIEKAGSGTILQSAAIVPNSTTFRTNVAAATLPKTYPLITYTDPDGAAWTQTTVNSSQFGYKLTTAPGTAGRRCEVTACWGYVIYAVAVSATALQDPIGRGIIPFDR
jgi:hypothetical protein